MRDLGVHAGSRVQPGQRIGHSDSTGNSTGPHLHFEIMGGTGHPLTRGGSFGSVGKVSGGIKGLAQAMMNAAGFRGQFSAVNYIISHESGWRTTARNPSSGAYGLGQALPASKMRGYGPDYLHNARTQLNWFFHYIRSRYGSPNRAASFWRSHHWYGDGGVVTKPSLIAAGEKGPERVLSPPQTRAFENLVRNLDHGGGGGQTVVNINLPHYVGSQQDIQRVVRSALVTMDRRGALTVIKRTG
jgi:Peptidase family M23